MKSELVVICKKCGHNLFVENWEGKCFDVSRRKISKILKMDCPNCGEEGYENWILSRFGNFEKDKKYFWVIL